MTKNVGGIDRIIRSILGLALIGVALAGISPWGWIGIILLATALIGWCPPYSILGINTCKTKVIN